MRTKAILSSLILASLCTAGATAFAQPGRWDGDNRGPAAAQRDRDDHRDWRDARRAERREHAYGARGPQWRPGYHVPPEYRSRTYVVDNWRAYRLPVPRRGQHWIQVGSDFVLVTNGGGVIVQVLLG